MILTKRYIVVFIILPPKIVETFILWLLNNLFLHSEHPAGKSVIGSLLNIVKAQFPHKLPESRLLLSRILIFLVIQILFHQSTIHLLTIVWKFLMPLLKRQKIVDVNLIFFEAKFSLFPLLCDLHRSWKQEQVNFFYL